MLTRAPEDRPVVGIDDAQLQERTGLQNPGRMFRQLEKHGLVMRWNSKRNGRRHWRRRFDGTVDASGWSLAPLIFLVDAIELLVDEEHERLRLRCELPQRITVALEAIRRILLSGAIGTEDAVLAEGKAADLAQYMGERATTLSAAPAINQRPPIFRLVDKAALDSRGDIARD